MTVPVLDQPGVTEGTTESVFAWEAPAVRFGLGALEEIGWELAGRGVRRALLVTDAGVRATGIADELVAHIRDAAVDSTVWSGTEIEPTDQSVRRALAELQGEHVDAFVALGGGSAIDTCKMINLLHSHAGELHDYLSAPHGEGRPVPGPLAPMIGAPTTAGTGSECSGIAVVNLRDQHVKAAVSDAAIRPALAVVDPLATLTAPPLVTASAGYDALVQTLESYTSRPFHLRPRHQRGDPRPVYSGSTPISDIWSERALELMGRFLVRAVQDGSDLEARTGMSQAALYSRLGTAGAHIPHSAAYAIAGRVRDYRPAEFGPGDPLIPHGLSVVATAAAAFDVTFAFSPDRHRRAARLLGAPDPDAAEALGAWLRDVVRQTGGPGGLDALGFRPDDIPALVAGTQTQTRLLAGAPCPVDTATLTTIFERSFSASVGEPPGGVW